MIQMMRVAGLAVDLNFWCKPVIDCAYSQKDAVTYLALDGLRIVGVLCYSVSSTKRVRGQATSRQLSSHGTFVAPSRRKQGVAVDLWTTAMHYEWPKSVKISTVSDKGFTLVESLKRRFPDVEWTVYHDGERTSRNLKKGKSNGKRRRVVVQEVQRAG